MAMLPVRRGGGQTLTVASPTYLPGDVNADAVDAQLSNGVLKVTIPKSEAAKPRQIEIKG